MENYGMIKQGKMNFAFFFPISHLVNTNRYEFVKFLAKSYLQHIN